MIRYVCIWNVFSKHTHTLAALERTGTYFDARKNLTDGNCAWFRLPVFSSVKLHAGTRTNSICICRCFNWGIFAFCAKWLIQISLKKKKVCCSRATTSLSLLPVCCFSLSQPRCGSETLAFRYLHGYSSVKLGQSLCGSGHKSISQDLCVANVCEKYVRDIDLHLIVFCLSHRLYFPFNLV